MVRCGSVRFEPTFLASSVSKDSFHKHVHILYVTHGYKPSYRIGGPIWSVAAVAERLVQRGHRVTVFTTNVNLDTELQVETNVAIDVSGVDVWYFKTTTLLKALLQLP